MLGQALKSKKQTRCAHSEAHCNGILLAGEASGNIDQINSSAVHNPRGYGKMQIANTGISFHASLETPVSGQMLLCAAPAPSWLLSGIPFCSRRNLLQWAFILSAPGWQCMFQKRVLPSPSLSWAVISAKQKGHVYGDQKKVLLLIKFCFTDTCTTWNYVRRMPVHYSGQKPESLKEWQYWNTGIFAQDGQRHKALNSYLTRTPIPIVSLRWIH